MPVTPDLHIERGPVFAQYLAHLSVQELAEFYEGLRVWAPFDVDAQEQVATELCERVRADPSWKETRV